MNVTEAADRAISKVGTKPSNASAAAFICRMLLAQAGVKVSDEVKQDIREHIAEAYGVKPNEDKEAEPQNVEVPEQDEPAPKDDTPDHDEAQVQLQAQAEKAAEGD